MIEDQILRTEMKLEQQLSDKLTSRTMSRIIGVHDPKEREDLDREISSGLFLGLSFIIGKKIFTVGVGESKLCSFIIKIFMKYILGTVRSFVVFKDSNGVKSYLPLTPYHTLSGNREEELRIDNLKGIIKLIFNH